MLLWRLRLDHDAVTQQVIDHFRIVRRIGGIGIATNQLSLDDTAVNDRALYAAGFDISNKFRIRHTLRTGRRGWAKVVEHRHQDNRNDDPEQDIFRHVVQIEYLIILKSLTASVGQENN